MATCLTSSSIQASFYRAMHGYDICQIVPGPGILAPGVLETPEEQSIRNHAIIGHLKSRLSRHALYIQQAHIIISRLYLHFQSVYESGNLLNIQSQEHFEIRWDEAIRPINRHMIILERIAQDDYTALERYERLEVERAQTQAGHLEGGAQMLARGEMDAGLFENEGRARARR